MNAVVWKIAKKFPTIPVSKTEIHAYKDVSFFISLMKFDFNQNIPFPQFAIQQLKWFLFTQLRKFITKNYQILNYSSNLDEDKIFVKKQFSTLLKAETEYNLQYYQQLLDKNERQILNLKLQKYRSKEIAEILKLSPKTIDNNWQKIKKKLRQNLNFK